MEAVEFHIGFYSFSTEYILMLCLPPKLNKSVTKLELENEGVFLSDCFQCFNPIAKILLHILVFHLQFTKDQVHL